MKKMFRIGPLPKIKIDDGPEEDVERILTETHGIPHYAYRKAKGQSSHRMNGNSYQSGAVWPLTVPLISVMDETLIPAF
ncbi:unnamed protein product [Haemonchus placei]|uniref:Sulfate adenylyltransferase n=1 Tax=Haemonchus placei TaxID=6290 RepID=A0A0N4W9X4_HAEPC|nr:unnamed protein product [Haemonchus placei]